MSDQADINQMVNERECVHRSRQAEGAFYAGTSYIKALQRLPVNEAMRMSAKVGAFFWVDAPNIKVWLCDQCAHEIGL